jgi:1-acyl-sn-glycerol-3-phosphate acyltransferase
MFYLKFLWFVIWLIVCCTYGLVLCLVRWGDLELDRIFAHLFAKGCLKGCGIELDVKGREFLETPGPCVYVANHQGSFDLITFGAVYPKRTVVIGKKEIFFIPFFGLFFAAAGNIMIDRKRRDKAIAGLDQAVVAMREKNASIWIFPEGTRNRSKAPLQPFKKGAFHMAIAAQVPIVALLCAPLPGFVSASEKKIGPGRLPMQILPPFSTKGLTALNVDELSAKVHAAMEAALVEMKARA